MRTVLVIDDNPAVGEALRVMFALNDIRTLAAATPEEGIAALADEEVDLVIADMNFRGDTTSGEEGVALFRRIRERHADLPMILLTAWASLEAAVQLIKAGAADYIAKPWDDPKLLATVENLLELAESARERVRQQRERKRRRGELASRAYDLRGIVFASDAMERVVEMACRVARSDVPVLVTGPNGSGKERIADILHANSSVAQGPFVAVNCGAVPGDLIEAELFGAEAGAYTGANRSREGRFELADGGTLFLDEIGNLPLAGQVKLLRVLETGQFQRLGSSRSRSVPRAHHQCDQRGPRRHDPRRVVQGRPVLPAQRDRDRAAAARRAAARTSPPLAGAFPGFRQSALARMRSPRCGALLARQRARAAQCDGARASSGARRHHPRAGPEPARLKRARRAVRPRRPGPRGPAARRSAALARGRRQRHPRGARLSACRARHCTGAWNGSACASAAESP